MTDEEFIREARAVPIEVDECRTLWASVLMANLRESRFTNRRSYNAVENARSQSWLGSRDFQIVCAYAGFDPETVEQAARNGRFKEYLCRLPRFCSVPSCSREIERDNRSAVCRKHQHAPGYCRCRKCAWGKDA